MHLAPNGTRNVVSRHLSAALAVAAAFTLAACTSGPATSPAPSSTSRGRAVSTVSAHPFHLIDIQGAPIPAGRARHWGEDTLGSPVDSDPTGTHSFAVPSAAAAAATFLSPRGRETDIAAWNASGWLGLTPAGILLPNVKLSGLTTAGPGRPSGTAAVARQGGDYSLGIAFLDGNGHVIEADFAPITVLGDSTPTDSTWSSPPAP